MFTEGVGSPHKLPDGILDFVRVAVKAYRYRYTMTYRSLHYSTHDDVARVVCCFSSSSASLNHHSENYKASK
jgi:hypothetical protein